MSTTAAADRASKPTSSDRLSKRPTKKRALTPVSEQAQHLDALFAKPDQEIRIPTGAPSKPRLAAPPEIVTNVQGSSAGAGSGEFHVYKASRRREYERLRRLDEELKNETAASEFERAKREREAKDDEKTRKNREKREKMKARKANKKATTDRPSGSGPSNAPGTGGLPRAPALGPRQAEEEEDDARPAASSANAGYDAGAPASAQTPGLVIHDED